MADIDQRLICDVPDQTKNQLRQGQRLINRQGKRGKNATGLSGEKATFGAKTPLLEIFALIIALNY
jgi:hypothetical protein